MSARAEGPARPAVRRARADAWASLLPAPRDAPERPFPGLAPFDSEYATLFFGRETERRLVVTSVLTSPLTVLHGSSGTGKTSLLRAGVIPELFKGTVARGRIPPVVVVIDRWQTDPMTRLRSAVATAVERRLETASGIAPLAAEPASEPPAADAPLHDALVAWSSRAGAEIVLVLDQFEDHLLYRAPADDPLRDALPLAAMRPETGVRFLIAVREDAVGALDRFAAGGPIFDHLLRLEPISDEAALEAITRPVDRFGELHPDRPAVELESGLAESIVRLLHGEVRYRTQGTGTTGAPAHVEPAYLQLVMRRLWDTEVGAGSTVLRAAALQSMGGVGSIVRAHVESAMDALPEDEQAMVERVLPYLITPSGAKIAQSRPDIAELAGVPEARMEDPLETLGGSEVRVLRPVPPPAGGAPGYEIFHDVLARPLLDWRAHRQARRLQQRAAWLGAAVAAATAIMLVLAAYVLEPSWLRERELATVDARFGVRGATAPERDTLLVDLDDASVAALGGSDGRIPRPQHARLIARLTEDGARVIAYDFAFGKSEPPESELQTAISRAGATLVIAANRISNKGRGGIFGLARKSYRGAAIGYSGFLFAPDGAYRQVDLAVGLPDSPRLQTFAVAAARAAGDRPARVSRLWIDYHGPRGSYPSMSYSEALEAPAGRFRDKVVVVGSTARVPGEGRNIHPTAGGQGRLMSGAEIQANAISTIRRGTPLQESGRIADLLLIIALGLAPVFAMRLPTRLAILTIAGLLVPYVLGAFVAFAFGWIVPVSYPLLALLASTAAVAAVRAVFARASAPALAAA